MSKSSMTPKKWECSNKFLLKLIFQAFQKKTWLASKARKPNKPVVKGACPQTPLSTSSPLLNPLRERAVLLLMMIHSMLMKRISANCFKTAKISYHLAQPGTLDRVNPWKYSWHSDFWNQFKQTWCTDPAYLHTGNYLAVYYILLAAEYQYKKKSVLERVNWYLRKNDVSIKYSRGLLLQEGVIFSN